MFTHPQQTGSKITADKNQKHAAKAPEIYLYQRKILKIDNITLYLLRSKWISNNSNRLMNIYASNSCPIADKLLKGTVATLDLCNKPTTDRN